MEPLLSSSEETVLDHNNVNDGGMSNGRVGVESNNHSNSMSRILDRDGVNHQSRGRWRVEGRGARSVVPVGGVETDSNARQYARACWDNWFHSLVYTPTLILLMFLLTYYMSVVIVFAWMYMLVSHHGKLCHVDINNFLEAMFFSLSTMTTIGYGVKDYYFGDCWSFFILVSFQVCSSILFDAVAIGLIFQRLSRGQKRGRSILLSDTAVLRKIRGSYYLFFRVGELRTKHFLMETRVRAHMIRHERSPTETFYFVTRNVPVGLTPNNNDDVNHDPYLLMSIPQLLVHKLTPSSPFVPPSQWYDSNGHLHYFNKSSSAFTDNPNNDDLLQMQQFWQDRQVELIVLIEGIDEVTGMAVQARHSYRYDDILLNHTFVNCVFPSSTDKNNKKKNSQRTLVVDWDLFHHVVPAAYNCQHCPYISED